MSRSTPGSWTMRPSSTDGAIAKRSTRKPSVRACACADPAHEAAIRTASMGVRRRRASPSPTITSTTAIPTPAPELQPEPLANAAR